MIEVALATSLDVRPAQLRIFTWNRETATNLISFDAIRHTMAVMSQEAGSPLGSRPGPRGVPHARARGSCGAGAGADTDAVTGAGVPCRLWKDMKFVVGRSGSFSRDPCFPTRGTRRETSACCAACCQSGSV